MNLKTLIGAIALLVLAYVINACGTASAAPGAVSKLTLAATEYAYTGPDTVPAGLTEVTLVNRGQELHQAQFVRLADGKSADDFMTAMQASHGEMPVFAKYAGGPNAAMPGSSATALVNLEPGTYVIFCQIPDGKGASHLEHGMWKALKVTPATGAPAVEPEAAITVNQADFSFTVSGTLKSGTRTFRVNNLGKQAHEALLVQLPPDKSAKDFVAAFAPDAPPGPPPGKALGGLTGIEPGDHAYFVANLTPGKYAFICFFDDAASHAPHFALGMMQEFTVEN